MLNMNFKRHFLKPRKLVNKYNMTGLKETDKTITENRKSSQRVIPDGRKTL